MKVIVTKGVITSEGTFQKGAEAEVSHGLGTSLINSGQAKKVKNGTGEGTSTGRGQPTEGKKGKRTRSTTRHKDGGGPAS